MLSNLQEQKTWQEAMQEFDRAEHAQRERDRSNGLFYSLDDEEIRDFLENQCLNCHCSPYFILVRKEAYHILHEAMNNCRRCRNVALYSAFGIEKVIQRLPDRRALTKAPSATV